MPAGVPDTTTFAMSDVVTEIGAGDDLIELFSLATGTFDPAYEGAKDNLLNFRNYTHTTPLSAVAQLVIDRMGTLTGAEVDIIATYVDAEEAVGNWTGSMTDCWAFGLLASNGVIGFITNTAVEGGGGSLVWARDGVKFDGVGYLDTLTSSVSFPPAGFSNVGMSIVIPDPGNTAVNERPMGARTGGVFLQVAANIPPNISFTPGSSVTANRNGPLLASRYSFLSSGGTMTTYENGTLGSTVGSGTQVSVADTIYIGGLHGDGALVTPFTGKVGFAAIFKADAFNEVAHDANVLQMITALQAL